MSLNGRPLRSSTLLPARDPVLLHFTFHKISPGFVLRTKGLRVGEAADVLTPVNIAIVFVALGLRVSESNFRGCHDNSGRGGGVVDKCFSFLQMVFQRMKGVR